MYTGSLAKITTCMWSDLVSITCNIINKWLLYYFSICVSTHIHKIITYEWLVITIYYYCRNPITVQCEYFTFYFRTTMLHGTLSIRTSPNASKTHSSDGCRSRGSLWRSRWVCRRCWKLSGRCISPTRRSVRCRSSEYCSRSRSSACASPTSCTAPSFRRGLWTARSWWFWRPLLRPQRWFVHI